MTENEKRLRESLGPSMLHHLEMLLAEKAEEKRAARAEALQDVVDAFGTWKDSEPADVVRRMMTAPALASIPVKRVREVLAEIRAEVMDDPKALGLSTARASGRIDAVELISKRLGVPLDAAQEVRPCALCRSPVETEDIALMPETDVCRRCHNKLGPEEVTP